MIIKILKSSTTLNGIHYNEDKNELGKSELLVAKNFDGLDMASASRKEFVAYMQAVANLNPRVKNKQFHAVLSTKGRLLSAEKLKDYAQVYLQEMGYGKNPYLIYSHNDTQNNHVHIVSTRVDKKGFKISDKYERLRSQTILQNIFNQNFGKDINKDFERVNEYKIDTLSQYQLLWENLGYKTKKGKSEIQIITGGVLVKTISTSKISIRKEREKKTELEKELYAKILKFSQGLTPEQLKRVMHKFFGIQIIYHTAKGHEKPYGYTVIDYKNKQVFKGSKIFPLNGILNGQNRNENTKQIIELVPVLLKNNPSLYTFKIELSGLGVYLSSSGSIHLKDTKQVILSLGQTDLMQLNTKQNELLFDQTRMFSKNTTIAFSKLLHINFQPVKLPSLELVQKLYYKNYLQTALEQKDKGYFLKDNSLILFEYKNEQYLWDKKDSAVVSLTHDLGLTNTFHKQDIYVLNKSKDSLQSLEDHHQNNLVKLMDKIFTSVTDDQDEDMVKKKKLKPKGVKR